MRLRTTRGWEKRGYDGIIVIYDTILVTKETMIHNVPPLPTRNVSDAS